MEKLPRHVAIIMDGNGRWAKKRNHNRTFGHARGVERAREVIRACADRDIEALTLYTFSTENWQRPSLEVNFLMKLLHRYLANETEEIITKNLRFHAIGCIDMLPKNVREELARLTKATEKNTGMILQLALSYGSRRELTDAVKKIAAQAASGKLDPSKIDEALIDQSLYTNGTPDPDLLIRTGGDHRVSNFLLWQIAYAELYFTDTCWPDFTVEHLQEALDVFAGRERRFGGVEGTSQRELSK